VVIKPFPRGTEIETENWVIQDGIVVIPKNTIIPAGTVIAPDA
jgi:glucose-1-phosphate adenylyltransferase